MHLRDANGVDQSWTGSLASQKVALKNFLLNATAKNMANMLSAKLAATKLNAMHGFYGSSTAIYVDGALTSWSGNSQGANLATNLDHDGNTDANADDTGNVNQYGFADINGLIAAAESELTSNSTASSTDAWRAYQEALKIVFDAMNNNLAIFSL